MKSKLRLLTLLVTAVALNFSLHSAEADLVGFWDFNDGTATDVSGNGNDGTNNGATFTGDTPVSGGGSVTFDGSSTIQVPHSDSLLIADAFSLAFWMKASNADQPGNWNGNIGKISEPREASGWETQRWEGDSRIDIRIDTSGGANSVRGNVTGTYENEWKHVAWTVDAGNWISYLDGVEVENGTYPHGDGFANTQDLFFGNRANCCNYVGSLDEIGIWDNVLLPEEIASLAAGESPIDDSSFVLNGRGMTYTENFDEALGTSTGLMPKGWTGIDTEGEGRRIDSLGLTDGPLTNPADPVIGIVNVGGNAERFSTPADGRLGTWQDDLNGTNLADAGDVIADAATDRALGNSRASNADVGSLTFEIPIGENPLRAFVAEWDLEVWGGDPEAAFRGAEGGGYSTDLTVNDTSYYTHTAALNPGDLFDSAFDLAPGATNDPTLINGNEHAVRGNSSGIVEVFAADGAVGNIVNWTFNADHGGADGGWISAVDNVLLRALAAGDAQADGDVDPADLIQLLAGGAFGQGNIDATWGQGDFDNDGDFDGTDILAVVQGLAGEFPKSYAHDPSNSVPDVLINPATGNITLDTNGTTIGSIVMDSAAGIFNGPNSPSWDAPGDFAADIDTQISMPISFTNPGYTGVDDLGDGIIGDLAPGFDILADLTIKYLDPNGDLLDAEAHVVPEPSSIVLAAFGVLGMLGYLRQRRLS